MKKKVLATVLATAMVAASLVGCGGSSNETGGDSTPAADGGSEAVEYGSGTITIWVAENVVDLQMRKQQNSLQQILIWQVIRLPLNL